MNLEGKRVLVCEAGNSIRLREGMARMYRWITGEMVETSRVPAAGVSRDRYAVA